MKRILVIVTLLLIALCLFIFGPTIIRHSYAIATPSTDLNNKIAEYRLLDAHEASLSGDALRQSQLKRVQIYYWVLARNRDIDGGDGERTLFSPWNDLIRYWSGRDIYDVAKK